MDLALEVNQLTNLIKQIAIGAVDASKPLDLRYGTVTRANPLRVQIDLKLTLEKAHLVVPKLLTDHNVTMEIDGADKVVKVKNALKLNDRVALLREKGGKRYFIIDRV